MAKVKAWRDRLLFHCPGCDEKHWVNSGWNYNGNADFPTFQPSILVTWEHGEAGEKRVCHSYVSEGHIRFLADSTHALAGQTVPLPELDAP